MVAPAIRKKSRTAALLEDVRLQNVSIVRKLGELHEDFGKRFDEIDKRFDDVDKRFDGVDKRFDAMEKRIELLEDAVRTHSREIKELRAGVAGLRSDLEKYALGKGDRERIEELEKRVASLEKRLG